MSQEQEITEARAWTTRGDYARGQLVPGSEECTSESVNYMPFPEGARVGNVTVGLGRTINLGNFESLRVDVRVSIPALVEQIEDGSAPAHAIELANIYANQLTAGQKL